MDEYDVCVVGGRCAGAPLATHLARAGLRVALVDRARFPSDVASTHGIQPNGVAALRRLGVYDQLAATTTPIERASLAFDDARAEVDGCTRVVGAPMLNIRRVTLDAVLLRHAEEAGVAVRTETPVTGLLTEGSRVVGAVTPAGPLHARVVVGADGVHSAVARLVGAEKYAVTPPERTFLWCYLRGVSAERDHMWLGKIGDWGHLACPTDDDLWMVAVAPTRGAPEARPADRAAAHAAGLATWPELADAMAGGERVGPARSMGRWHGYFRRSAGPGWCLVGDAGHFKDPSPGQGIADALRQAEHLAAHLERGLAGPLDRELRRWWAWRDRDAWAMYWLARDFGAAGPLSPLRREVMRAIVTDQVKVEQLARVLSHQVAPDRVFSPQVGLAAAWRCARDLPGERRAVATELGSTVAEEVRRLTAGRAAARRRRTAA